jgi:hypothetical protein
MIIVGNGVCENESICRAELDGGVAGAVSVKRQCCVRHGGLRCPELQYRMGFHHVPSASGHGSGILSSRDVANASTETAAEATVEAGKRAFVRIGEGRRGETFRGSAYWSTPQERHTHTIQQWRNAHRPEAAIVHVVGGHDDRGGSQMRRTRNALGMGTGGECFRSSEKICGLDHEGSATVKVVGHHGSTTRETSQRQQGDDDGGQRGRVQWNVAFEGSSIIGFSSIGGFVCHPVEWQRGYGRGTEGRARCQ